MVLINLSSSRGAVGHICQDELGNLCRSVVPNDQDFETLLRRLRKDDIQVAEVGDLPSETAMSDSGLELGKAPAALKKVFSDHVSVTPTPWG